MPRKQQPNVTPEFIGEYYVDEENHIFKLKDCQTEPMATMTATDGTDGTKPISEFSNLVRLKRTRELPKAPEPRATRKDKGQPRKGKNTPQEGDQGKSQVSIHTPANNQDDFIVTVAGHTGKFPTFTEAKNIAIANTPSDDIDALSDSDKQLLGIE